MKFSINASQKLYIIVSAAAFAICLLFYGSPAGSRPSFTEAELTKARNAASTAKYPIDFDKLMDEADRLGVECEGDLTDYIWIRMCSIDVDSAQVRERTAASKRRIEESKKRQEVIRRETARLIIEAADMAEKKLQKIENKSQYFFFCTINMIT